MIVIKALPLALAAGLKLNVPLSLGLEYVIEGVGMRVGLLEVAVIVRFCSSLVAPVEMPDRLTVRDPASSARVISSTASSVGGWFTPLTVSVKVSLADAPSGSETRTVMMADPERVGIGVTATARLAPDPLNAFTYNSFRLTPEVSGAYDQRELFAAVQVPLLHETFMFVDIGAQFCAESPTA